MHIGDNLRSIGFLGNVVIMNSVCKYVIIGFWIRTIFYKVGYFEERNIN
jgi:hypothetical protein